MKNFLRVTVLAICAIFMVANVSAQGTYDQATMGAKVVEMETASWGQNKPYNDLCPTVGTTPTKTGCGPTAFAILCHYYKWPVSGSGSVTHNSETLDLSTHTYDYENMLLSYSGSYNDDQATAVATLMRDLGYATKVGYGTSATTFSENIKALKANFSFTNSIFNPTGTGMDVLYRSDAGDESFKQQLKECLSQGYPILFTSLVDDNNPNTTDGRHIFILDGYTENEFFHFNFGWNGYGNGWYTLDNVRPDEESDYSTQQRAYLYVIPNRTPRAVTASVSPAGAGTVTVNGNANSAEVIENTYATLVATANSGYTFSHWSKGGAQVSTEKTYKALVAAEGNDYVANFLTVGNTRVNVSVSYNSSYGTVTYNSSAVSGTGITPYQNSEVTLVATPLDGYVFNGWTVTKGTNSTNYAGTELTFVATEDMSVEARFSLAVSDYTISTSNITKSDYLSGSSSYCSTWETADGIVLSATLGSEKAYALSASNPLLYAKAATESSGDNLNNGITFTLTAPNGYSILNYSIGCYSNSNSYSVDVTPEGGSTTNVDSNFSGTISANVNAASARFTLSSTYAGRAAIRFENFTVTLQKEGAEGSTPTPDPEPEPEPDPTPTTYNITAEASPQNAGKVAINGGTQSTVANIDATSGSTVSLQAYPNSGYEFAGWYNGTTKVSSDNPYSITATAAISYIASFQEAAAEQFPDGAYKIYWQADNRGYLAYHGTDYPNEAKLAGVTYSGCQSIHYAENQVDLVWYLITASDGKRYLFEVATGKFLGVDTSIQANGTGNKLSTTEAWPIAIEENTNHTGHYIITTEINGTNNLLCSGCGTPKEQHPVRWLIVNEANQKDGGAPLQLVKVDDVTVADNVMNAVLAVINGTDEPEQPTDPLAGKYFRLKTTVNSAVKYMNVGTQSDNSHGNVNMVDLNESSDDQIFLFEQSGDGYKLKAKSGNYIKCAEWNVNANTTNANEASVLLFEESGDGYLINWYNTFKGAIKYFNIQTANAGDRALHPYSDGDKNSAAVWALEEVIPSNEKKLNVTYSGATWSNESGGYYEQIVTNTTPAVTIKTTNGAKAIGYSTISSVRHPYLLHNNNFIISVPAPYKIAGYKLTYKGDLFSSGKTFTYTNGTESTATETITQNGVEKTLTVTGLENSEIAINVSDNSSKAGVIITALEITYIENEFEPLPFKAEIENWRDNNPNTHLGTITVGGTAMKLTPAHQTASELTMPLAEGTTLAFTRKYRGFDFNGFYIGSTSLGTNPTLTADNVAAINETTPLVAKFTATDDVTLFYDDDQYSYRIPAIAKTGNGMLVAVSDYRHNLDDIGRDNHRTGTMRIDLVMRTSTDNGATWSETKTIAAGDNSKAGSYLRAFGDAAIAAVGQNIVVMAAAGDVLYGSGTTDNPNRMARIYSTDNGANWTIEEMTTKMYSQSTSLIPSGGSAFFGSGKLAVDPNFNGTGNARIYGALLVRIGTDGYNNFGVFSDDLGATWKILGGDNTNPVAKGDEPKVEILPNGQILLSARRGGGRVFRVFTYGDDKANGAGSWGDAAVNGCDNGGSNATNGDIICLDAKRPNGKPTKILLQSQPKGGSGQYDRKDVTIWYKEVSADETYTSATIASGWTMGKQVSTVQSSYSAMCLQANGEIALFFEEAPCYADDYTKGYSMVYVPLTIEEITNNNFLNPNADVEYVPVEFNIELTDTEGNIYRETLDYVPNDAAAVATYLTTTYPFITLGENGAIADNTYTNTVTLPFKVSNANTTVWHNIYFPANGTSAGEYYPIYLMAENENATAVAKITEKVHYGNSQYNTYNYADKLAWAVYNVNEGFTFKFKNKLTGKFMAVTGVSSDNTNNVVYTDEAGATAFTLEKYTGGNASYGNYAIKSVYNSTTGYVCNTSVGYTYATNYPGTGHAGAWVKFVESPDYWTIYNQLIADIDNFGAGEGKYTANDAISSIDKDALASMPLNSLNTKAEEVQNVKESYREVVLTVNDDETETVPGSVSITVNGSAAETVNNKFVPANATVSILATANPGYRFVNWTRPAAQASAAARTAEARNSDVVSDQNPYTVTVSEALNLEANFEKKVINVTLTDNTNSNNQNPYVFEFVLDDLEGEVTTAAIANKLMEKYPVIKSVGEGNSATLTDNGTSYTYTNTVKLPFEVANGKEDDAVIWYNIYYPANLENKPNYLSASTNETTLVEKINDDTFAYGDNPTYNTESGNNPISWAIYSVDKSLTFTLKNKVTGKYIQVTGVATNSDNNGKVQNAVFADETNATAFTFARKTESFIDYFAFEAEIDGTTGYLCSTASSYGWATHYNSKDHRGGWARIEDPAYYTKYIDLSMGLYMWFSEGNGFCAVTSEIQAIEDALANYETITLNTFRQYGITIARADSLWPTLNITINPEIGGFTAINGEEGVTTKRAPADYKLPIAAVPAEGYHFVNWTKGTDELSTNAEHTVTISGVKGDVTELTANFAKNIYRINVGYGEGGSAYIVSPGTTNANIEHGNAVTLTAVANDGYEFVNWTKGTDVVSTDATYTFTATVDGEYVANFELSNTPVKYYTVRIETEGLSNDKFAAYINTGTTQNETAKDYEPGSTVRLIAIQDNSNVGSYGYAFVGWYLNETLVDINEEIEFNITSNVTYTAKFVEGIRISTRAERGWPHIYLYESDKEVGGTSMSTILVPGRRLKLSVTPEYGCRFTHWTVGDEVVSTDNPFITEPLNEAVTFKAICEPAYYNLTVRSNPATAGKVTVNSNESSSEMTVKVGHNTDATITATPNDGFKFVNWTKGTDVVSTNATYTIAAIDAIEDLKDVEYIANFIEVETAEPGVYYRFAYEFPAAAAASAARAGATRAAGDTYTYTLTPQNIGLSSSNNSTSSFDYSGTNPVALKMTATTANGSSANAIARQSNTMFKLYAYANGSSTINFNLSAPDGYKITGYNFTYKEYTANTITVICNDNKQITESTTSSGYYVLSVTPDKQTAEFTLQASANQQYYLYVKEFTVTIQEVGSSEGEGGEGEGEGGDVGGGETPETPETPETVKYYIQSEACGVTNKTNALLMTQETGAASIFYYADSKLLSYDKGTYLKENRDGARGLQAVGEENAGNVTITTADGISKITAPSYLHANETDDKTVRFVDHCTNDGCANHKFVLEEVTTLPVTISSALHATFYAPVAVEIPEGVRAYVLKEKNITADSWVTMTMLQNGIIPANTGVILRSDEAKTYDFIITENTDAARAEAVGNILEGTVAKSYVNKDAYILTKKSNGVGMYPLSNNSYITGGATATFTNNSHKAYLPVEGNFARLLQQGTGFRFVFDDEGTTGIDDFETEESETIYDLQGRKLSEITEPGIYIVNGKKIFVK